LYDAAGTLATANAGHRILSVDRANKTVTVEGTLTLSGEGFITVQGSYNRELCGLGAIFGDTETLYGLSKAENPFIHPTVVDAKNDLTDLVLYRGIKEAKDYKGANIDLLMMGDDAFLAYQDYIHTNNVTVCDKYHFVGGAVGYKILVGSNEVIIVNERFVPENEVWGVDTSAFYLEATPWNFMEKDGGVFVPMPDTSIFRALLASYGNLMCVNPGGCVRFVNAGQTV
ncbi:MAG: hypothetical protein IIU58_03400, partial [Clostridia bacterium]|nr:hypothetical protein [Clostridia bacterium]